MADSTESISQNPEADLRTSMALQRQKKHSVDEGAIIDLTFTSPLPKECLCLLCKQLLNNPCHLTCCKSRYCDSCAKRMLTTSYPCVKCSSKQYRKERNDSDQDIKHTIQMLQAYCPMKSNGCSWSGKVKDLEDHLCWGEIDPKDTSNCRFLPVPCPRKCGQGVPRRDMEKHVKRDCECRHVTCEHCGYRGVVGEAHKEKCETQPVECPNGCKMPGIKRIRLPFHLDGECPLRLISCDYQHIGCEERLQYKDRLAHNEKNLHEHFYLMTERVLYLSNENERLTSLCLSVEYTCNKLQEQYNDLASLIMDTQQQQENDDGEERTYVVIKRNSLKRLPTLPQRTRSMLRSASADQQERSVPPLPPKGTGSETSLEGVGSMRSPPLPPKGLRGRASVSGLPVFDTLPTLPPKSQSTSTPSLTKPTKVPMFPPKRNKSVPSESQLDANTETKITPPSRSDSAPAENQAVKKTPPPPPARRDSLSAPTLPRKNELKHQRQRLRALSALTPIRDESLQEDDLIELPDSHLSSTDKTRHLNKSLPNLLVESPEENSAEEHDTLKMDTAFKTRSWSSSSNRSWRSHKNPSYLLVQSVFSGYEVHAEIDRCASNNKDDSSSDISPSSDKESPLFGSEYQNITFKSETLPATPVKRRTIDTSRRRPLPAPRKWKSTDGVNNEMEDNKLYNGSTEFMNNITTSKDKIDQDNCALGNEGTKLGGKSDNRHASGTVAINPMYPVRSELESKIQQHRHT